MRLTWIGTATAALLLLGVAATPAGAAVSASFAIDGAVDHRMTYDLAALEALPSVTETVTYKAGGSTVTSTFTGVSLWSLLDRASIVIDPGVKNDILSKYVVAIGSDGYRALFGLGELSPDFGNAGVLVAYAADGHGLGDDGFARIVAPGDVKGGRFVSNLTSLTVGGVAVTPLPGTLLLLTPAVAGLAIVGKRQVRRA